MTNLVYLTGHGFCGSTLLTFLLNAHPDVATCGEMGMARRSRVQAPGYVCSCGAPIVTCDFWRTVRDAMIRSGHDFDVTQTGLLVAEDDRLSSRSIGTAVRGPLFERLRQVSWSLVPSVRAEARRLLSRNERFVEILTSLKGCGTFLDSTKQPPRALLLRRSARFSMRVIHLVRDGRGISLSSMRNTGHDAATAARLCVGSALSSERLRRHFPADRWLTVRYEDLCADPSGTLATIVRFIGLAPVALNDFRGVTHHIIGNRMRLNDTATIVADERWRRELTTADRRVIDPVIADYNRRYGYTDTAHSFDTIAHP